MGSIMGSLASFLGRFCCKEKYLVASFGKSGFARKKEALGRGGKMVLLHGKMVMGSFLDIAWLARGRGVVWRRGIRVT
jgi:hypothetical protein